MTDYGASDTSTTSLGANQFPISDVYVPNVGLKALGGGPKQTDGSSKDYAPALMYVQDGSDVAQGLTTDTAVVGDNPGTVSAKMRGLTKIFNDVWDSTNHWFKVAVQNTNANGQTTMSASAPVVIASDQSAVKTKSDFLTISSLSAGSLNADLLASTDISAYGFATITVTGTWVGTISAQYCDDNSTFTTFSSVYNTGGVSTGSITANNQYVIKGFAGRFLRLRMTSYTSGTANATITFYTATNPLLGSQFVLAGQNGTWTIQPGNTANTTPWLVQSNAGTNLNTSLLALESGGNLASAKADLDTIAGAVTSSKMATKAASGDFVDGAIATIGAQADTTATTDSGTFSLIALFKRLLAKFPTIGAQVTSASLAVNIASDQVVPMKLSTVAVYSLASTTTSGSTQNSGDVTVGAYREISIDINTTAQAGTAPTLQLFYERKAADGIYYVLWQSAVLTAATNTLSTSIGAGMAYNQSLGATGRLRWVVGGSATPTFTFSASIQGK